MFILFKLQYAKFDVSRLFCSKVIEEKPFGGSARPPLVKEGLRHHGSPVQLQLVPKFNVVPR